MNTDFSVFTSPSDNPKTDIRAHFIETVSVIHHEVVSVMCNSRIGPFRVMDRGTVNTDYCITIALAIPYKDVNTDFFSVLP